MPTPVKCHWTPGDGNCGSEAAKSLGCEGTFDECLNMFNNEKNFGGFPGVPNAATATPHIDEDIEAVEAYRTTDGHTFNDMDDARKHQARIRFVDWYEEHKLYGSVEGCRIEADGFLDWLDENSDDLEHFFSLLL